MRARVLPLFLPASIDVEKKMIQGLQCNYSRCLLSIFSAQYITYVFNCIRQWRKNRKWSFSCLLALLLPLNELQGELSGMAVRNILTQQFQSGDIEMPSITKTLRETVTLNISMEEEEEEEKEEEGEKQKLLRKERTVEEEREEKENNKAEEEKQGFVSVPAPAPSATAADNDDDDNDDDEDKGKERGDQEETILLCPLI